LKTVISLDGRWKLQYFDFGRTVGQFSEEYDDSWWIDAEVPGEVHETLLKHGLIEDPLYGKNCDKREWVERVDWWYRRRFEVPEGLRGKRVLLVFEGLDTFATVWLNGERIASSEDMFIPLVVDVTDKLRYGAVNTLAVRLGAPWYETIRRAGDFSEKNLLWNGNYSRLYARKAQYQYEWDWAVKLLTVGIWRSVKLVAYDHAVISDVYVRTLRIGEGWAELEVNVEVESLESCGAELSVVGACGDSVFKGAFRVSLSEGYNSFSFTFKVENPRLWWPVGYGPQNLYSLEVALAVNGVVEDTYSTRFGIRTVELVTESDEASNGKVFYFKVNGEKVFCKGANWIPADLLISRVSRERYRQLLQLAIDGNHNMLRVWGGGLVEYDDFYNLCDEMGIMLWHDFQFACGHYPDDDDFLKLVEREVEATVRRLRNHPSIILWCGNNEDEALEAASGFGLTRPRIDFEVIPGVVARLDPSRPYWPSSPYPLDPREGDNHNWVVYHGLAPIDYFLSDESRFLSEFGMQAAPHVKSMRRFLPPGALWPVNEYWLYHYHVPEKVVPYMKDYGEPRDLYSYVYLSMMVQADTLKTAIEHSRRRKFECGGVLYWSFNAPWPNMCWETVDYYGMPKMSYYVAKRAFEPVLVSPVYTGGVIRVWLVNDTLADVEGVLEILTVDVSSNKVAGRVEKPCAVRRNSSTLVAEYKPEDLGLKDPGSQLLVLIFRSGAAVSRNVLLLTRHRDVRFSRTQLSVEVLQTEIVGRDAVLKVRVRSQGYARLVAVDVKEDNVTVADDNYFDLLPGEDRVVSLRVRDAGEGRLTVVAAAYNAPPALQAVSLPGIGG